MRRKKACIVVDIRDGVNIPKITDMIAVLAAAGWQTDLALKAYGGEGMKLATEAVKDGYDAVVAYGGDGTLNQVINGVMNAKGQSVVGVIPGGTANEWASESGVPLEPFHAALALVNSEPREVDLGYMDVRGLIYPGTTESNRAGGPSTASKKAQKQKGSAARHRFLLMAGLGLDAAVTTSVSKSLKYRVGQLAYALAAVKELPEQRPFPVELREVTDTGEETVLWQGEAWQVMFQRKSASVDTQYFQGAHFSIRVPASIGVHLDGSVVELKDYLKKSDHERLMQAADPAQVLVDYRFDAEPAALHMTIPRTYNGALFEKTPAAAQSHADTNQQGGSLQQDDQGNATVPREPSDQVNALVEHGTKVTVVGVGPNPDQQNTYIIAGTMQNEHTGDTIPVAVRVNDTVTVLRRTGEHVPSATVQTVQEGAEIVVEGKKSKRGAIRATHVVL